MIAIIVVDVTLVHALPPVLIAEEAIREGMIGIGIETTTDAEILAGLLRKEATTILEDIDMTYHPNQTPYSLASLPSPASLLA